jgi:hypothetical protein
MLFIRKKNLLQSIHGMVQLYNIVIESKYSELEKYAHFINDVSNKGRNVLTAISNAYIHAQKHTPKTEDEAKAILLHYIKCELLYTQTATHKENITAIDFESLHQAEDEPKEHIDFHYIIDKEVEEWNFIDRKFFEKWMEYKKQGKKDYELAELYGIDKTYCRKKLQQLKRRIRCKI